jgi:hypothetical protein
LGEIILTVDGGLPGNCVRLPVGPNGEARHYGNTVVAAPPIPPFDVPVSRILELDLVCSGVGTYTLVATAVEGGAPFGWLYLDTSFNWLPLRMIDYQGTSVAAVKTVTCLSPTDLQDTDGDSCIDVRELSFGAEQGGFRDPSNFWDYFDVPAGLGQLRDEAVSGLDFFAVLARFGSSGNAQIDPLSPPPALGYHTAFDRGGAVGPNGWNVGEADGSITGTDFFTMLSQFGHSCA